MARSFSYSQQRGRHYCPHLYQQLPPGSHVPEVHVSNNGMEFKNQLLDDVLQQLGIDHIFSAPYYPQNNEKLEVSNKYLKPYLKKLWEWPGQLGPILQPSTNQLLCHFTPHHRWNTLLPHLWLRPQSAPTPTARDHAMICDPDSGCLKLKM